ncbi:unnamed protein product, partial [Musa hybrid cultivar]
MSAAAIACSRGAATFGFRCWSLMRLPAAQVGYPRSNLSLLQRFTSDESNGSRACLIDTLALVKKLEKEGVPSKQAEAITKDQHYPMLQRETEENLRVDIEKMHSELRYEID